MNKITRELVAKWIPTRDEDTYKNKLGHVLCIGGNKYMGGAIILSASAALNAGSGLVSVASAPENLHALHARIPEAMFLNMYENQDLIQNIQKADVIVLGPGLGLSGASKNVFTTVLENVSDKQWLILDGDALTLLSQVDLSQKQRPQNLILTPHLGEWNRLTGIEAPANDLSENKKWKERLRAEIVLKKDRSEVYLADAIWKNTSGNPSMATGGMGDTLTGILGSFIGQFEDKAAAILSAVYVHSAAADDLAETHYVTLPSKVIEYLPIFIQNLKN